MEAVRYLHEELCVAHRDLNSHNVVLIHGNSPRICDFGLAAMFERPEDALWMAHPSGAWSHASPEMLLGGFYSAFRADSWSLGVLCFLFRFARLPVPMAHEEDDSFSC